MELDGKRILVVGLGESGLAMARWCARRGEAVRVADTRAEPPALATLRAQLPQAEFVAGAFDEALLEGVDVLAWSPGLSIELGDSAAFHAAARARGLPVLGELDLFAAGLAQAHAAAGREPKVLAITGTNGKTTTTRLAAHLVRGAGLSAVEAGNVAPAMLDALATAIDAGALPDVWVLELSSFQLAVAQPLACDAAVVLNLSDDHLDWHASMASYAAAKRRILQAARRVVWNREDAATLPPADALGASFGTDLPTRPGDLGVSLDGGLPWLVESVAPLAAADPAAWGHPVSDAPEVKTGRRRASPVEVEPPVARRLMPADALRIRGRHNHANALAALALARAIGLSMASLLHALRDYAGEPHRCQTVAVIDDVEWIDDSKGTNVGATVAALQGLGKPAWLVAGGVGKGQDFGPLAPAVARHARGVLLVGRDAPLLRAALSSAGVPLLECASLEAAVAEAAARARTGEAVLLSPACASFDMFRDYAHRAEVFVAAVRALAADRGVTC